jgi:hypothetical protein
MQMALRKKDLWKGRKSQDRNRVGFGTLVLYRSNEICERNVFSLESEVTRCGWAANRGGKQQVCINSSQLFSPVCVTATAPTIINARSSLQRESSKIGAPPGDDKA